MSLRFQKRIKVMPGVRLNISKSGVSTSIGRRGASVTVGKRGLYGNVGVPGSGLSYRTKIDKKTGQRLLVREGRETHQTPQQISLQYDKHTNSAIFVDETGQPLPHDLERKLKQVYKDELAAFYAQKEQEINEQTTKLLTLHQQTRSLQTIKQLKQSIEDSYRLEENPPNELKIYHSLKDEQMLSFFEKVMLLLPSRQKQRTEQLKKEAQAIYLEEKQLYEEKIKTVELEKEALLTLVEEVAVGNAQAMEKWLTHHLAELDFPLETNVGFEIISPKQVYLDVDLPQMDDIPLTKATLLKSGKLKVKEKTQRETREQYAIMVGGTAVYLCSVVFSLLPTCESIVISGFTQVKNEATGHLDDQYIYSLKVNKDVFYSLNISDVHPFAAFENFEPIINATKTFIFKEIKPYEPN